MMPKRNISKRARVKPKKSKPTRTMSKTPKQASPKQAPAARVGRTLPAQRARGSRAASYGIGPRINSPDMIDWVVDQATRLVPGK